MADKIRIHTGRLGNDADRIQSCIDRIRRETGELKDSVTALERMWEGPGREAFHKSFREDMQAMETVISELKSACAYDVNAKKKYELCEKKISSLIADMKV